MEFDFSQQPGMTRWNLDLVNTGKPLVSIVTPYYNGGKYIRQTCNCVLNQTFPYYEWIIVDDGSTNLEDLRVLEEIVSEDPRFRVLHKENGGISSARNHGIRHAATDLILPLDADDLLEPTFVEYCWWMLQKNPDAAWSYVDSVGFQGQEYLWHKKFNPEEMKRENLLTATALIRKKALEEIGLYDDSRKHYNEDWYAWLKILAKGGYPVQCSGEYLFWYRRSDNGVLSLVRTDKETAKTNQEMIAAAATEVQDPAKPIYYPVDFAYNWQRPVLSDWDQCCYRAKNKKHILFLLPHLEMGGADKFNLDLIAGLDPEKFDTGVITTVRATHAWQQAFRAVTPNIFNLANFVDPQDYAEFITYYLKSRQVDVLFLSNSYHGYYLVPWLRENFPELTIVDYVHMEEWYWRNGGYARCSGMLAAVTEKTYVCNSATRDVMLNDFNRAPESVETVYIGVDEEHFSREKTEAGLLYSELGIEKERPVVLFICRLHPQKRPFLMLEIAQKVKMRIPGVVFAVVGDGPQESELREKVQSMGISDTVRFLGAKKDVRPYYRDAKVTLVCSLKEGLSLTAYESCAMGVPVVSSDVGGQRDLVDLSTGALVPCLQTEAESFDDRNFLQEEIQAYVDAICSLLQDPEHWRIMSENCRKKIEESFTIRKMVEYFEKEFFHLTKDEALAQKRRSISVALQACSPLAAELFTAEMQAQSFEEALQQNGGERLPDKIKRVLKTDGFLGLIRKILKKIIRKLLKR